jgi:CRP-like cAMP-binding protein
MFAPSDSALLVHSSRSSIASWAHSSSSFRKTSFVPQVTSVSLVPAKSVYSGHHTSRATLNELKSHRSTDLDHLSRLKALSWLSPAELNVLVNALALTDFKRLSVILHETGSASEAHILLTGIARITCINARGERVTVALIAPGLIPELPALPLSRSNFQCEAYNDCRVGTLSLDEFECIAEKSAESAFRHLHENDLKQWYRLLLRSSSFLNLGLHERIAITLLELCSDFGVEESRGTLLRVSFSQKDIANLVGASRPRVTEHLARLEREAFVVRQGRQLIVRVAKLQQSIGSHAELAGLRP